MPRLLIALLLLVAPGAARAQESAPYRTEEVRYHNGDVALAGLLMLPPAASGPVPAAVIIQGSGRSDRTNMWARSIAEALVRGGTAVLLTDNRGSGASGGDWQTAGFGDLAADALAGLEALRARADVDSTRVGLVGLSQGGWIAPLAAARSRHVAFVVDISGAGVSYAEQSFHEMGNTARQAGLDSAGIREVLALNRAAGAYLVTGDWDAYRRAREHALTTGARPVAAGFPAAPDAPIWTMLRQAYAFDPLPYWLVLEPPVLVMLGAEDERDNVPVAVSVHRLERGFAGAGKTNARVTVIPGAGHGFFADDSGALMPAFTQALAAWMREHVTAPR
ncbi:alpha/beta hydrolase family protein [Longimicrobium sp.]|uniref:alpha/beta hydrolase family protein n=1 Tax=Longimicrobium sp. TaxID=2029185 RepID=UPI002E30A8CB|nr:alpha/beta fold hydrolase [Longimicrobium sp.]HEX6038309.1 alpha/beta fold hydrolase [Longimicrobium sp.]